MPELTEQDWEAALEMRSDPDKWAMRSCWNCNAAHEHLRQAEYVIMCFDCGHWFYKGHDLTEEARRMPNLLHRGGMDQCRPQNMTP